MGNLGSLVVTQATLLGATGANWLTFWIRAKLSRGRWWIELWLWAAAVGGGGTIVFFMLFLVEHGPERFLKYMNPTQWINRNTFVAFWMAGMWLCLGAAIVAINYWRATVATDAKAGIGSVTEYERNGFPVLAWRQEVGTMEALSDVDARKRFRIFLGMIAIGVVIGGTIGGYSGAIGGAVVGFWFGMFGLRGAGTVSVQGTPVPHTKTDTERREEITPVTRTEDCEAFLEPKGDNIYFCIARRDSRSGTMLSADSVPWDSFENFEEGSHKQWFRARGNVDERVDWDVIVAQSNVGQVIRVAESVGDRAWLVELLVKLQGLFIASRPAVLKALREAADAKKREAGGNTDGMPNSGGQPRETPVKSF